MLAKPEGTPSIPTVIGWQNLRFPPADGARLWTAPIRLLGHRLPAVNTCNHVLRGGARSDAKRLEVLKQIVPSGQRFELGKLDKPKP